MTMRHMQKQHVQLDAGTYNTLLNVSSRAQTASCPGRQHLLLNEYDNNCDVGQDSAGRVTRAAQLNTVERERYLLLLLRIRKLK